MSRFQPRRPNASAAVNAVSSARGPPCTRAIRQRCRLDSGPLCSTIAYPSRCQRPAASWARIWELVAPFLRRAVQVVTRRASAGLFTWRSSRPVACRDMGSADLWMAPRTLDHMQIGCSARHDLHRVGIQRSGRGDQKTYTVTVSPRCTCVPDGGSSWKTVPELPPRMLRTFTFSPAPSNVVRA